MASRAGPRRREPRRAPRARPHHGGGGATRRRGPRGLARVPRRGARRRPAPWGRRRRRRAVGDARRPRHDARAGEGREGAARRGQGRGGRGGARGGRGGRPDLARRPPGARSRGREGGETRCGPSSRGGRRTALAKTTRDATEAKEQVDRLLRAYGERPAQATVRRGAEAAAERGEYAAAVEGFERALGMGPLDAETRLGLGGALLGARAPHRQQGPVRRRRRRPTTPPSDRARRPARVGRARRAPAVARRLRRRRDRRDRGDPAPQGLLPGVQHARPRPLLVAASSRPRSPTSTSCTLAPPSRRRGSRAPASSSRWAASTTPRPTSPRPSSASRPRPSDSQVTALREQIAARRKARPSLTDAGAPNRLAMRARLPVTARGRAPAPRARAGSGRRSVGGPLADVDEHP